MKEKEKNQAPSETSKLHKSLTIVGIVLCVILIPILIINCTLIIKSFVNKDEVPSIGGLTPLIVLTDSMYPDIKSGDIIVSKATDVNDIKVGDVISFFDPAGNGSSVVTHQVIEILEPNENDGKLAFRTQGTNNNTPDKKPVAAEKVIGVYTNFRVPAAGHVALFMQTTAGLIVCVMVPLILLVGYDIIRRRLHDKDKEKDMDALMAELEALKKMQNAECRTQNEAQNEAQDEECNVQTEDEVKDEKQSD